MGLPNDSTRFDVAWLVIWIILSFILIGLVCIRKLALPAVLYRPDKTFSMVFAFLQLCAFTFILAALAYDGWSVTGGNFAYGVVRAHERGSQDFATDPYSKQCDNASGDAKDLCQSGAAAGAFTLIFGLISVLVAFALLISIVMSLLGKTIAILDSWRAPLANIQWISTLAQVMIWSGQLT